MTDHKMPDVIFAREESHGHAGTWCDVSDGCTSYTRTDIYDAVVAERDALRELCEGMAGTLKYARKELEKHADYKGIKDEDGALLNIKNDEWKECEHIDEALAAFEKHKGVG